MYRTKCVRILAGTQIVGHDDAADKAVARCAIVRDRLNAGIAVL